MGETKEKEIELGGKGLGIMDQWPIPGGGCYNLFTKCVCNSGN